MTTTVQNRYECDRHPDGYYFIWDFSTETETGTYASCFDYKTLKNFLDENECERYSDLGQESLARLYDLGDVRWMEA